VEKVARVGRNLRCDYQRSFAGKQTSSEKLEMGQMCCSKKLRAPCEDSLQNPSILMFIFVTWKYVF
jgi:hypothetical protein